MARKSRAKARKEAEAAYQKKKNQSPPASQPPPPPAAQAAPQQYSFPSYDYGQLARQTATAASKAVIPSASTALPATIPSQPKTTMPAQTPPPLSTLQIRDLPLDEQAQQARYFRITDPHASPRCLSCARKGHMAENCHDRICSHCNAIDQHRRTACPGLRRCRRCGGRGHSERGCASGGRAGYGEAGRAQTACELCAATSHVEEECSRLWRTFVPEAGAVVRRMPARYLRVACYSCGSGQHWGGDCTEVSLRTRRRKEEVNPVWNKAYVAVFEEESGMGDAAWKRGGGAGGYGSANESGGGNRHYQIAYLNDMRD